MQVALLQPQIKITQTAIINGVLQEVYNARTLHSELQSKKHFADWIKNRLQDFAENVDFISFTPISEKPLGGRPSTEYLLTIDTAKHLSMMEQTEIGKQVRLAFIEAEKELILKKQAPQVQQLPQNYIEALEYLVKAEKEKLVLENTVKEKNLVIQDKEERLETARKVFKKVADNSGCRGFRECSIDLGIPQKDLRERLEKNKWICPKAKDTKGNKVLKPTVSGSQYDYVKYMPKKNVKLENGKVAKEFVITEKGYNKLLQQLGKVEELKQMQK